MEENELEPFRRREVELVMPYVVSERAATLAEVLRVNAEGDAAFSATMVEDHLAQCLVFVSWNDILIRPLIPPTSTHRPFAGAAQRVYMSATLGSGGEIERAFGVPGILRLPVPTGWDEHGTGRRFFLFPGASRTEEEVDGFIRNAITEAGRALILAPSRYEAEEISQCVPPHAARFDKVELEAGSRTFARSSAAVMTLANRYDGIDLPDDACRLIILTGLPSATHLQERFLYERLGATRVLAERVRTRVLQGAGRCTRNDQDFAAVVMRGDTLLDFCARTDNVRTIHPELQAEIEFGYDNSESREADPLDLLKSFLSQDPDWQAGDDAIRRRAREVTRDLPTDVVDLERAAQEEVEAWQAAWRGDLEQAIDHAQRAADRLGSSPELRSYRALWLYLAASWAALAAEAHPGTPATERAIALQAEVEGCARALNWVPLIRPFDKAPSTGTDFNARANAAATRLLRLGIRGEGAETQFAKTLELLASDAATPFELGMEQLGPLLGFEAVRMTTPAAPDGVWRDATRLWLILEAKTEEAASSGVSVSEVRQANTHYDWVNNVLKWEEPDQAVICLLSYKTQFDETVQELADERLYLTSPTTLRDIARRAIAAHREVRARARGLSPEQTAAELADAFHGQRLDTANLVAELTVTPIRAAIPPPE
jgi:Helicase C-terminal domain